MREHLQLFKWYGTEKYPMLAYKKVGTNMDIFHMDDQGHNWDWIRVEPRNYYDILSKSPAYHKLEKLIKIIFEFNGWKSEA